MSYEMCLWTWSKEIINDSKIVDFLNIWFVLGGGSKQIEHPQISSFSP